MRFHNHRIPGIGLQVPLFGNHDVDWTYRRASLDWTAEGGCPHIILYNHPLVRAILAASTRLLAPSLLIASER